MIDATQVVYLTDKQEKEYKRVKRTNTNSNKVYTDEDLDAFDRELGL